MVTASKWIVILFGVFLIAVGFLMLFSPEKAREYLRKAGSTNFINYFEITVRMIPAAAMILYSEYSKFPEALRVFGWFMIATSLVLYFVPRKLHHAYAIRSANLLSPTRIRLISPASIFMGGVIIYGVI